MPVNIDSLTSNVTEDVSTFEVTGDGIFDKLMETITKHISIQYKAGRISGNDYATVYVTSLQAALQQSMEFVLKEELTNLEIEKAIKSNALLDCELDKCKKLLFKEMRGINYTDSTDV